MGTVTKSVSDGVISAPIGYSNANFTKLYGTANKVVVAGHPESYTTYSGYSITQIDSYTYSNGGGSELVYSFIAIGI